MKDKILYVVVVLLAISIGFIVYQNFIAAEDHAHGTAQSSDETQLWTCGMHPDIITEEPGNCPICGMKLTPIKNDNSSSSGKKEILYWVAPMDPNEIYNEPGKSKMGMDLVPVYADEAGQSGVVTIDPEVQQNMNVKITSIEKRSLDPSIETNASFFIDERKEHQITARVGGWIEKLAVNYVGQNVNKDDLLLEIYSPEMVAAQQEYLTALNYQTKVAGGALAASGQELVDNTYRKLSLLNMSSSEIFKLENSGEVKTTVPLYSPVSGTVLMKYAVEGEKIKAGQNILHIVDLSNLWLKADIYESDLRNVKVGNKVSISVDAYPGQEFRGVISFIYPTIDPKARVTQVRIDVANTGLKLKPSMLAKVKIHSGETKSLPLIPETAVIRSGQQNVAVQFLGDGKFKPVKIQLGNYSDGFYQVLSGLNEGNNVVTSAQFLIDSESSLKTAMKNFGGTESAGVDKTSSPNDSPLIRKGVIDLKSIDENSDGMVYQDPMDWNVISDKPGKCPICEMTLKEVSLKEAEKNLTDNGFKVKDLMKSKPEDSSMKMETQETKSNDEQMSEENHDHGKMENEYGVDSPLIRIGKIDVKSIDKNGDGKLWECPMDWNIIGDEYQRCPVCEMKMKEYTLDEVKKNLEKHGYEHEYE